MIGSKLGYQFQHALNGGEVVIAGYFLDGYDISKNVVFEYDEPHHHQLNKKKKDLLRQKRIIERIHPRSFIRYDEKTKKLYDVINGAKILII